MLPGICLLVWNWEISRSTCFVNSVSPYLPVLVQALLISCLDYANSLLQLLLNPLSDSPATAGHLHYHTASPLEYTLSLPSRLSPANAPISPVYHKASETSSLLSLVPSFPS